MNQKRLRPALKKIPFNPNLKFIKEYDLDHFQKRLYVHYDILSKCNLHCSYCYAIKDYKPDGLWGKIPNLKNQILILDAISKSKFPVFLGFLGGEPTLHPDLKILADHVYEKILTNPDSRFYITTNGIKKCNINFHENVFILMSIHPEARKKYGTEYKKFFENLEYYLKLGFKVRVNEMLLPDSRFFDDYDFIFEKLKSLECSKLSIHPHFLYKDQTEKTEMYFYPQEFWERFKKFREIEGNFIFETESGYCNLTDYDVFELGLNQFKGWKCFQNNFEIDINGNISNLCHKKNTNILEDPLFFRKLKLEEMTCPFEKCVCDGLLKTFKHT